MLVKFPNQELLEVGVATVKTVRTTVSLREDHMRNGVTHEGRKRMENQIKLAVNGGKTVQIKENQEEIIIRNPGRILKLKKTKVRGSQRNLHQEKQLLKKYVMTPTTNWKSKLTPQREGCQLSLLNKNNYVQF